MELEHREADPRRVSAIRGLRGLQGHSSAAILAASRSDFQRIADAGGRPVCGGWAIRRYAVEVRAQSLLRRRTSSGTCRSHYDGRATPTAVPAIYERGTGRPRLVRQHLSLPADYCASTL